MVMAGPREDNISSNEDETSWVPFTIRLPKATHRWLKDEAFFGDTTMSAIVRDEIEKRRIRSGGAHAARRGPGQTASGPEQGAGAYGAE